MGRVGAAFFAAVALAAALPPAARGTGALVLRAPGSDAPAAALLIPLPDALALAAPTFGDADGTTTLHLAAAAATDARVVEALVLAGEDPGATDASGRTPLHVAATRGDATAVAAALVSAGAPVDARDASGRTALHLAASPRLAALLVGAGADVCALDAAGRRALDLAKLNAMVGVVEDELYARASASYFGCF